MKRKQIVIAAMVAAVTGLAIEARSQTLIKEVRVTVDLRNVMGVTPEGPTGSGVVDLVYESAEDYIANNKSVIIPSQFTVTSTVYYEIMVRGTGDFFGQTTAGNTLPLNILRLSARRSGVTSFGSEITPTTTDQAIVTGAQAVPTLGQGYDILYNIPRNASFLDAPKQRYSTDIIYSIIAQ